MHYNTLHIVHLLFLFLLVGTTFAAFAAPVQEKRRKILMLSGIYSLVVLISGIGLLGALKVGFPGWIHAKLVCWFILSALAGLAFRMPNKTKLLSLIAVLVVLVAIVMVEFRF